MCSLKMKTLKWNFILGNEEKYVFRYSACNLPEKKKKSDSSLSMQIRPDVSFDLQLKQFDPT